jgi:hypothetical protein
VKQPSDFRAGVEAAAKWIRTQDSNDWYLDLGGLAIKMVSELDLDNEGTEARTVAQIVQYIRERTWGMKGAAPVEIERIASDIEAYDWKRS